jgi:hypothetical protein
MDSLTIEELKKFIPGHAGWHISLFMPTEHQGQETDKNRIRFKNLLKEAEHRLLAKDIRTPAVRSLIQPAQDLLERPGFWRHQSQGLAVFFTSESFDYYRLPLPLDELLVISDSFHIKPLLPLFSSDGHFYILALSQNQVRLLEGTRHAVDEINLENMPKSMAEALQFERFIKDTQFHTGTSTARYGGRAGMFHGHDPSDEEKTRILRWFHRINDVLPSFLVGERSPLVLAGVEYLFPLYKQANHYSYLIQEGIPGNPEELKPEELHDRAWPIVEPYFRESQEKAAARFFQKSNTDQTATDISQVVLAADHGRVADLFIPLETQVWGTYEAASNLVEIHQIKEPGDKDLLDLAAIQTILNGGEVYAVPEEQIPNQALLAAVFRY